MHLYRVAQRGVEETVKEDLAARVLKLHPETTMPPSLGKFSDGRRTDHIESHVRLEPNLTARDSKHESESLA
jgi:hypothetical protein